MIFLSIILYLLLLAAIVAVAILMQSDCDLTLWILERWGKSLGTMSCKVVWIIGASSGIGEHLAYQLSSHGCKLILSARREDELNRVKDECVKRGFVSKNDIFVLKLDITQINSHQSLVEEAINRFGQIDILINNCGRTQRGRWTNIDLEVDRQAFEINLFGIVNLTRCVMPHFIKRKAGHVVAMSSLAGKIGLPGSASYTGSKHALHGYMESLRWEQTCNGIDVTLLCPGPVMSPLLQSAFTEKVGETVNQNWSDNDRRMPGERCGYLCSVAIANKVDEAWITQQPYLFLTYANQYFPSLTRKIGGLLGYRMMMKMRDGSARKED